MYRLRVLGGFSLDGAPGAPAPPRPPRRGDAVLAVLAVCGDLGCTRDRLGALLWPESDEARSHQALRDALYAIRRSLDPGAVYGGRLMRLDADVVASDVHAFAQALAGGRQAEAVRWYAGPLLDGFHVDGSPEFERWLDGERTRLAREYAESLEHLATTAERTGTWHEAVGWWGRAVEHDPLNSHFVLQHARAMAAIGDRANAVKAADAHTRRLREDLDVEPDREVLADIERIRRGDLPARRPAGLPPSSASGPPSSDASAAPVTAPALVAAQPASPLRRRGLATLAAAVVLVLAVVVIARRLAMRPAEPHAPRTTIAVLPFQLLNADSTHAYFADGLHDELLSQLSRVAALRVIGRTSVNGYQTPSQPLRRVGRELAAGSVVEASVQVVGNQLRVIAQLEDPVTQEALWSQRYDGTLDDAFTVQNDIAQRIVAAVGAKLTGAEAGAIASAPTQNAQAYDYYLQGLEYVRRPGLVRRNFESAQQLYERALALDSTFAPAHAALAWAHWDMFDLGYDRTAARLELARREAETARRLAPDLPAAHLVFGLSHYVARGDNRGAIAEFSVGLRGAPNDAALWASIGRAQRHLGNWDSALAAFDSAGRIDPRNADLLISVANTLHFMHRYRQAVEVYRRAIALAPDAVEQRLSLGWSYAMWTGDFDTLRAVLRNLPLDADPGGGGAAVFDQRVNLLLWERRPDSALALLRTRPLESGASGAAVAARALVTSQLRVLRGDSAGARAGFRIAADLFGAAELVRADDWGPHAGRGLALAWLGRRAEVSQEARWLERSRQYREDRYNSGPAQWRARMLARVGDTAAALAAVEPLLAHPSLLSVTELRVASDYDLIRTDPRFVALLSKYADPESGDE